MKILMMSNNYVDCTRGGVELHVYNLAHALVADGHDVHVARTSAGPSTYDVGETVPLITVLGDQPVSERGISRRLQKIQLLRFAGNFLSRVRTAIRAGRALRSDPDFIGSFDIIHHHDFITSVIISRLIRPLDVTQVWTNHLGEFLIIRRIPLIGRWLTNAMTRSFARGIGPSAELSDQSTIHCPVEYISNGVNTKVFTPLSPAEKIEAKRKLGWKTDGVIAIVPRRWAPTKGVIFAAQAMSRPQWPENCEVVFAGSGESDFPEYSAEIRRVLASKSATHITIESLSMEEMSLAIQAADLCIIPSLMEATSLSALEAMSAGLPIIGTNVGGLPEIIKDGVNGHLVQPRDPDAIASSVAALCSSTPEERSALGQISSTKVSSMYSWAAIAVKTMRVYRKALA